jgi:MFS family permease
VGGYLVGWTWRSIFWINVPIAAAAILLTLLAAPAATRRPARMDARGLLLVTAGVALSVLGFEQAATWGWASAWTLGAIVVGAMLLVGFVVVETRTANPLLQLRIFGDRAFLVENVVLGLAMSVFVPLFFFASVYAQVALDESASQASLVLLYFFGGFVAAAQVGGRMLDRVGARRPVIVGSLMASGGLLAWARAVTSLDVGHQVWAIVLAGAGMGLMLGQANTDALNHAPSDAYGEATGITQTIRNYGAALGLAVLGTVLVSSLRNHVTASLLAMGAPSATAHETADRVAQLSGAGTGGTAPPFIRIDVAAATQDVLFVMAGAMALAALVAIRWLPRRPHVERVQPARVPATAPVAA